MEQERTEPCTLEDHDKRTCEMLNVISARQEADLESNRSIRDLLEQSANLHKESATNLKDATSSIKMVSSMQKDQADWYQKQIEANSVFWRKVVWRTLAVLIVIALGYFGLSKFFGGLV